MIFNVSTFYNTPERVASLLVKITNQVAIFFSSEETFMLTVFVGF